MKQCPNGHSVDDNAKFCPQCGAEIVDFICCPICGKELVGTEKFCPICGNKFANAKSQLEKEKFEKERLDAIWGSDVDYNDEDNRAGEEGEEAEDKKKVTFFIGVLVFCLFFCGFVFIMHKLSDNPLNSLVFLVLCLILFLEGALKFVFNWRRDPDKAEEGLKEAFCVIISAIVAMLIMYWDGIELFTRMLSAGRY